jgi:hypothetical protein
MQLRNKASKWRGIKQNSSPPLSSNVRSAARKQRRVRVGETSSWDHEAAAATASLEAAEDDGAVLEPASDEKRAGAGGERDGAGTERRHVWAGEKVGGGGGTASWCEDFLSDFSDFFWRR